ncbi:MAG: LCP family protein [bacterium]
MIIIEIPPQNSLKKRLIRINYKNVILTILVIFFFVFAIFFIAKPGTLAAIFQKQAENSNTTNSTPEQTNLIKTMVNNSTDLASSIIEPKLKHKDYLTSVLLIGMDTRFVKYENGSFSNNAPQNKGDSRNTDTIMQIVYDNLNENVFMISIPRDMGSDVNETCLNYHASVNEIFDRAEKKQCLGGGIAVLKKTIENMTGIEIQYYGIVTIDAFQEIVNTIGEKNDQGKIGIRLDNPTAFTDYYPITNGNGFEKVYFAKGEIFLTGEQAIKYVRTRQTSSDFSRIRRQQDFILALKNSALKSEVILNPQKVLHLLQIFNEKTMFTSPNLEEIRAGIEILQNSSNLKFYHIFLDPNLGGNEAYIDKQPNGRPGGAYYMTPTAWKQCPGNEFCQVKEYIANAISNPLVFNENATIAVYSQISKQSKPDFSNSKYQEFKNGHYNQILVENKNTVSTELTDNLLLFDFSEGNKPFTIKFLEEKLGITAVPGSSQASLRKNGEDFVIVMK